MTDRTKEEHRTDNTGLAKVAVQCSADTFVVNQSLVLRINICGENRYLRQALNRIFIATLLSGLLVGCESNEATANKDKRIAIENLMAAQIVAWGNGDLEGFMAPYAQTDSLLFVNKNGLRYGWKTNLAAYQNNYGTPEKRGRLVFENLQYSFLGTKHVQVTGKWLVSRGAATVSGYYTLIWENQNGNWVIVLDHTS